MSSCDQKLPVCQRECSMVPSHANSAFSTSRTHPADDDLRLRIGRGGDVGGRCGLLLRAGFSGQKPRESSDKGKRLKLLNSAEETGVS